MVVKTEITTGTFDPRNYKVECLIVILFYCTLVHIKKNLDFCLDLWGNW